MQSCAARFVMIIALFLAGCSTGPSAELEDGWELMLARDYPGARDHYQGMLAKHPKNPYVHLNLGVAYHQIGNYELARQDYEVAIQYGEDAEVSRVVEQGEVAPIITSVADKGRENLEILPK